MLDYIEQSETARTHERRRLWTAWCGEVVWREDGRQSIGQAGGSRTIEALTFNLSQYQQPSELADAFHLVRDIVIADEYRWSFSTNSIRPGIKTPWVG